MNIIHSSDFHCISQEKMYCRYINTLHTEIQVYFHSKKIKDANILKGLLNRNFTLLFHVVDNYVLQNTTVKTVVTAICSQLSNDSDNQILKRIVTRYLGG